MTTTGYIPSYLRTPSPWIDIGSAVAAYPGRAVAFSARGTTNTTAQLVSVDSFAVRDIYPTPSGTTWTIRLHTKPRFTLTSLTVCVDGGLHALSRGTHPADGTWSLAATSDPFIYELLGSVSTGLTASIFGEAHAYVPGTLNTVRVGTELNNLGIWLENEGGGFLSLPVGGMYLLDRLFFPASVTVVGGGGYNTFFFFSTYAERVAAGLPGNLAVSTAIGTGTPITTDGVHVLPAYNNVANFRLEGVTIYGYRPGQKYGVGAHALSCGADTDTTGTISISVTMVDVHVFGSAGYGCSLGGHNGKLKCLFDRCSFVWTDSDNFDTKNRLNTNDDLEWRDCRWGYHALGDQGTNLKPPINMPSNPFTTSNGSSLVTSQRNQVDKATSAGEVATFTGAVTFNGVTMNGSFPVQSIDSLANTITYDITPQVANASGAGGGSSVVGTFPHISVGDVHVDLRGRRMRVRGGTADAEYWRRSGFRQRGGLSSDAAGEGGTDCMFRDLTGVDHSPSWVGASDVEGRGFITMNGVGGSAQGIVFRSAGNTVTIAVGATAVGARAYDVTSRGANNGIQCRGSNCEFGPNIDIYDSVSKGVENYGMTLATVVELDTDCFTPSAIGSPNAVVRQVGHGNVAGVTTVRFSGTIQSPGNGLNNIVPSNSDPAYTVQNPMTADTFTIIVGGAATNLLPWGGPSVEAHYNPTAHIANNNTFIGVKVWQSGVNTATGWSIGKNTGNPDGRAANTRISLCEDHGSNTPWEDQTGLSDYAGGNASYDLSGNLLTLAQGAIPNNGKFDTITGVSGLTNSSWGDPIAVWDHDVDGDSASATFTSLVGREFKVKIRGLKHNSGSSQNFHMEVAAAGPTWRTAAGDYGRIGVANGTSSIVFCSGVASTVEVWAIMFLEDFDRAAPTDVRLTGATLDASTGLQTLPAICKASEVLTGFRIVPGGGSLVAGVIEVFRKQGP